MTELMKEKKLLDKNEFSSPGQSNTTKNEMYIENRGVKAVCCNAANNITSGGQSLTLQDRMELKTHLGTPTTKVVLPSGDMFDTRCIASGGKHSSNNKLGDKRNSGSRYDPHPGMVSNLEIDFSNQGKEFKELYEKIDYTTGTSETLQNTLEKDCAVSDSDSDIIEIVEVKKEPNVLPAKKHKNTVIYNVKDCEVTLDNMSLVKKMHERIMRKSRTKLTRAIKATIDDKSNDREMKMIEAKKLKKAIVMLEKSENDNNHLNIIKSVTNDGDDLGYDEINSISSDDLLERVIAYHELEF